jgi:hypothetical protein
LKKAWLAVAAREAVAWKEVGSLLSATTAKTHQAAATLLGATGCSVKSLV